MARSRRTRTMNSNGRRLALAMLAALIGEATAQGQTSYARIGPWSGHVVVPQARSYAAPGSPTLEITRVTVGVAIRDQIATTMMEVRLHNRTSARQEGELLVPVPDGAVVRGFSFQGAGSEPSARLLPRDEARQTYERI